MSRVQGSSKPSSVSVFFLLAFVLTWSLQAPAALGKLGLLRAPADATMLLALLGVFGPALAAMLVTAREGGREAIRNLYSGFRLWRLPLRYYFVALALPGLLISGGLALLGFAGRDGAIAYLPDAPRLFAAILIALGEEVGWRGFALPRLQQRMHPFAASGVLGVLWTLWHVPMFVGAGVPLSLLLVMGLLFTGGSLVYTWLYDRSRGSLLIVVLAHVGAHLNNPNAALPGDVIPLVVAAIVYAALGLALMGPSAASTRRGVPRALFRGPFEPSRSLGRRGLSARFG